MLKVDTPCSHSYPSRPSCVPCLPAFVLPEQKTAPSLGSQHLVVDYLLSVSLTELLEQIFQQRLDTPLPTRLGGSFPGVSFGDNMDRVMLNHPRPPPIPVSDLIERLSKMPNPRSPREGPNSKPPLPTRGPSTSLHEATIARMRILEEEKEALKQYVEKLESLKDFVVSNAESSRGREKEGDAAEAEKVGIYTPSEAAAKEGVNALARARSFEALLQAAGEASKGREAGEGEKDGKEEDRGAEGAEKAAPESEMKADQDMEAVPEERRRGGDGTRADSQVLENPQPDEAKGLREAPSPPKPGKDAPVDHDAKSKAAEGAVAAKRAAMKESFIKAFIEPLDATVSFADFPYFLSETTKQLLIGSAFVHLKKNEYVKYTKELAALSPRMLLAGGLGTGIYQETLVRALAAHFGAKLMVMDAAGTDEVGRNIFVLYFWKSCCQFCLYMMKVLRALFCSGPGLRAICPWVPLGGLHFFSLSCLEYALLCIKMLVYLSAFQST